MSFSPHFLDEVRARVGIAGIVGKRVGLKRAGRELMGLCPFHKEKSPSFTVSEEKGFYHCFGCGAHGSVFDFLMQTENLSFPEAVERLAGEAGMEVPVSSPEEREQASRAKSLYVVMDSAAAFFEKQLHLPGGRTALEYLRNRGLTDTTIARFRLGFAPDSRGTLKAEMIREDFTEEQLIEGGLIIQPEGQDGSSQVRASYDRFRGRIMFPIADARGRIIAFGGRILDDKPRNPGDRAPAKYLNSPETPLFHKGRNLYGLAQAREHAVKVGTIIVTEGYTDVIALHQAGIGHAVAPLGTALTEQQIALLWRVVPEPVLCFDGDSAGERAALRAAERALPMLEPGHSLRFVALPRGEDPDSLVKSKGAEAMQTLLSNAVPLHDLLWRAESSGHPLDSPDARAALEKRLNDHATKIQDETVRRHYRDAFRDRLRQEFKPNYQSKWSPPRRTQQMAEKSGAGTRIDDNQLREEILLATLITHPELFDSVGERLGEIGLTSPELDILRQETLKALSNSPGLDFPALEVHLCETGFSQHLSGLLCRHVFEHARFARPEEPLETARLGWDEAFQRLRTTQIKAELQMATDRLAEENSEEAQRYVFALKEQLDSVMAGEL